MKNREQFIESAYLYMQASKLILAALPLQRQLQARNKEVTVLMDLDDVAGKKILLHNLNDEIFSCKIEIEVLRTKANRLLKQARYMRSTYAQTH